MTDSSATNQKEDKFCTLCTLRRLLFAFFLGRSYQGASCPPLTGKRASALLEKMRYSHGSAEAAAGGELFVEARKSRVGQSIPRKAVARKRAKKWTKGDRDLAEKELALVIIEGQQVRALARITGGEGQGG